MNQYQHLNEVNLVKKIGFRNNQALVHLQNRNQLNEQRLQTEAKKLQLTIALSATSFFSLLAITFYIRNKNSRLNNVKLEAQNNAIKSINAELDKSNKIIKEQNELLGESNSAKDKLFSIISHDLKNPIGALKGLIQFLANKRKDLTEEEIDEILQELKSSSSNVLDLLLELLTWSNSQRGNISCDPYLQDLYQLVYQNISILQPMAKKKNLQLVNKVMPNSLAYFDANMVNTILRNLLSNAIKFTKDGGNITIGSEVSATVNNELVIYVKDTGVGIPNERIEKLFHIQSNYTTKGTSGENGTGLGLIIVRDFIERNNGKIWVESVENTGTTFYFTMKTSKE
jgi:signal transduction histidine kinase